VRKGIGRKFQTPSIYENLSVFQNLEVSFPRGRGVFGALTFRRTDDVLDRVRSVAGEIGLENQLDLEAGLLSHGQKQWLEIGMLLMQEPKLLLLDEPVAGMSDEETERTAELFLSLAGKHSLVVVEHDMAFISRIARRRVSGNQALARERDAMSSSRVSSAPSPAARHAAETQSRARCDGNEPGLDASAGDSVASCAARSAT